MRAFKHNSAGHDSLSIDDFCLLFDESTVRTINNRSNVRHQASTPSFVKSSLVYFLLRRVWSARWNSPIFFAPFPSKSGFVVELSLFVSSFSLKSDTKWLSWLAYQFHMAVATPTGSTHRRTTSNDNSMDLSTFKRSFAFKVVRPRRAFDGIRSSFGFFV